MKVMTNKGTLFERCGLRRAIAGIFLLIGLVGVCGYAWGLEVSPADKKAYYDALAATETAAQEEISTKLLAVVPIGIPSTMNGFAAGKSSGRECRGNPVSW